MPPSIVGQTINGITWQRRAASRTIVKLWVDQEISQHIPCLHTSVNLLIISILDAALDWLKYHREISALMAEYVFFCDDVIIFDFPWK